MLEFKELQTETFKEKFTSTQLLFIFMDALHFVDKYIEENPTIERLNSQISSERFSIKLRFRNVDVLTFPLYWFACQSSAYRAVNKATRVNIKCEPCVDIPAFFDVTYEMYFFLIDKIF